jgi:DNA-directed RNA polymerase subunit RPC12/RpoP
MAEHQAEEMIEDLLKKMDTCLECGSSMMLLRTDRSRDKVEGLFLCPIHGEQRREFPSTFLASAGLLLDDITEAHHSIIDSFRCPHCGQVFAVSEISERRGALEIDVRCANGHKERRYIPKNLEESMMKKILQRIAHCDRCGLPGHIAGIEDKKDIARVHMNCPVHGNTRKDLPASLRTLLYDAVSEIPEDAVVRAMLVSHDCNQPLSIQEIEADKSGYKFRMICPSSGKTTSTTSPVTWSDGVKERITKAILACDECGLFTHTLDANPKKDEMEFKIVCPIHGVMQRSTPIEVFGYIQEMEPTIDRMSSIIRSLSCGKCHMPLNLRDVEDNRGLIEFYLECRNGHKNRRFFSPDLDLDTLVNLYKQFFTCQECHGPTDLVYVEPRGKESRAVFLCPVHGKSVIDIPHSHATSIQKAYEEIQADKAKPPVEVAEVEEPEIIEVEPQPVEEVHEEEGEIKVLRGCEIVGGKFDYKVKVQNNSEYVITNVTIGIVAYPQDCMELAGETVKTVSRIEIGGFRSPQFTFYPTKDCVQGKVVATVSYIDYRDQLHTLQVEPYLIRSVCDLLKAAEKSSEEFDLILGSLTKTDQEQTLDWNAQVLFTKAEKLLPTKNFHIVDCDEKVAGGEFVGTIRGYAEGKYTSKKVAVIIMISGPEHGKHANVKVAALGEDIAMLPTTIDELADSIDSWICLRCGAPLEPEQVEVLHGRRPIRCRYCAHSLTITLYMQ